FHLAVHGRFFKRGFGFVDSLLGSAINDDCGAFRGESLSYRIANSSGRAGNQRALTFQLQVHAPSDAKLCTSAARVIPDTCGGHTSSACITEFSSQGAGTAGVS